mmetsp:Transcript_17558/g.31723  ORF Transcript_17558/g.31723 Transcript_17558/m.31723 type:complete len:195 (+) Transcript_17558:43-627(+)|eukprot:CAMPEP_0202496666 /NCGR_PEP_ID=MMETSP1361-20130828/20620_1 /ASSEMBLY_ACC=CAM_ASM_000849 /TAXON_ID=210615 /ORGANISM="Staurosira complex sp., Strain CCMP2646" /LENGTH=194 /DNA_ID=CAMNT_0049128061 /DNA_START=49 /DNA_END=633 /DNA_ORIENTATION=+
MTPTTMMRPPLRLLVQRVTRPSLQQTTRPIPRIFRNACTTTSSFRWFSNESSNNNKNENNKEDTITTPEATVTITDEADHYEQSDPSTTKHLDKSEFTQEVKITMPDMGESTAKVVKWYKNEGDLVQRNDVLCDIETEDFTFGLTIDDEEDGIMGTIVVPADSETNVDDGDLLCIVLHRGDPDETKQDENANSE